jgi:3-deoxy-D-arabino-heptulosonate 7-phosphate (DAHP) synthase
MTTITPDERAALASAYCALVVASVTATDHFEAQRALEETLRIGSRLGVPADVLPQRGEYTAPILLRFAQWLEKDAAERARREKVFNG